MVIAQDFDIYHKLFVIAVFGNNIQIQKYLLSIFAFVPVNINNNAFEDFVFELDDFVRFDFDLVRISLVRFVLAIEILYNKIFAVFQYNSTEFASKIDATIFFDSKNKFEIVKNVFEKVFQIFFV